MELKRYQQDVITDLQSYLNQLASTGNMHEAYNAHWLAKGIQPSTHGKIRKYQNVISGSPAVCIKVPTGGGKTFLAVNALDVIFRSLGPEPSRLVIWLVPSDSIYRQTITNLQDNSHPYRQKLNQLFQGRVQIFNKEQLLSGAGLNPDSVKLNVNICVLIYNSLRAKNKEDRKLFQQNGSLLNFQSVVTNNPDDLEISAMQVVQALQPVVIVDESHNTTSELSVDMLKGLCPRFILELTATPREKSNIISFSNAQALKAENMVKLPILVYNNNDKAELLTNAIGLRRKLEELATDAEKKGEAAYIRPILLLQAQTKASGNEHTFQLIKDTLVKMGVKPNQIAIKTAEIDELKAWPDLQSKACPIRFIITINALKEGWDAPFAYILASMANKSSPVEVEQIVGRVLRLPFAKQHPYPALNSSYVLTASANFQGTLNKVVEGLNKAGFSEHDYRLADAEQAKSKPALNLQQGQLPDSDNELETELAKAAELQNLVLEPNEPYSLQVEKIVAEAASSETAMRAEVSKALLSGTPLFSPEEKSMRKEYRIKEVFEDKVNSLKLPVFYFKDPDVAQGGIFSDTMELRKLEPQDLLGTRDESKKFRLATKDVSIDFKSAESYLYKVDIEEKQKSEFAPVYQQLNRKKATEFISFINTAAPERQNALLVAKLLQELEKLNTPPKPDVHKYLTRLVDSLLPEQLDYVKANYEMAAVMIKRKIESLKEEHQERMFYEYLDLRRITMKPEFDFKPTLNIPSVAESLPSYSLYEKEGEMNNLERDFINKVSALDNILCWHRNLTRGGGFFINGFINHYPDFIVITKDLHIMLVETKGAHLSQSEDSSRKIKLGESWAKMARQDFSYYMAFESNPPEGGKTIAQVVEILGSR